MKELCRLVVGMAVVAMLAGCATAYKKSGLTGGYGESRIDSNHYLVYFNGNGYASEDRVWYFWIYRCAQLTRGQGFAYFSVTPVQSNLNKTAFAPEPAGYLHAAVLDGDAQGRAIEVHSSGGGFIYVPDAVIRTWHSRAIIAMYAANVPPRTVVLQAQSVLDLLAGYIKTNGSSAAPLRDAIYELGGQVHANASSRGRPPSFEASRRFARQPRSGLRGSR